MRIIRWTVVAVAFVVGCGADAPEPRIAAWGSSTSTISVAWLPVDGATGYSLERIGRDPITLPGDAFQYLDRGLAEGTYTYRLTALGTGAPSEDASATTSADAAVITTDDTPIGAPVVAVIGSAGGAVELPDTSARALVLAGGLPEGAQVALQQVVAPTGGPDLAVEVASVSALAGPIEVSFALDDDDRADLGNVAIAEQQADGTWLTLAARVESGRAVVTASSDLEVTHVAPSWQKKFVKFRRIRVFPAEANVRANTKVQLFAQQVYSDDICEGERTVALCRAAFGGVGMNDALMPLISPIVIPRKIKNSKGSWSLDGPGTLDVGSDDYVAIYTAPGAKPAKERWSVKFTTRDTVAWSTIRFINSQMALRFVYNNPTDAIGDYLDASVTDEFTVYVELLPDGRTFKNLQPISNVTSTFTNVHTEPPAIAAVQTSPYELFTATSGLLNIDGDGVFSMIVSGTSQFADSRVTFPGPDGPEVITYPGSGVIPITLELIAYDSNFANITTETWFDLDGTLWRLQVTPTPGF